MKIIYNSLILQLLCFQVYGQISQENNDTIKIIQYHNKQTNKRYESISFEYHQSLAVTKKNLEITFDTRGITAKAQTINEEKLEYKTDTIVKYDSLNFEELVDMFNRCLKVNLRSSGMSFLDGDNNCITYVSNDARMTICFSEPSFQTEKRGLQDFIELRSKIIDICKQSNQILKR